MPSLKKFTFGAAVAASLALSGAAWADSHESEDDRAQRAQACKSKKMMPFLVSAEGDGETIFIGNDGTKSAYLAICAAGKVDNTLNPRLVISGKGGLDSGTCMVVQANGDVLAKSKTGDPERGCFKVLDTD